MSDTPLRPVTPPRSFDQRDKLLSSLASKAAHCLRAGQKIRPASRITWSPALAGRIHDGVSEWLRTGNAEELVELLKDCPQALAHPAVITSVARMRRLADKISMADLTGEAELDGEFFSPKTCRAARDTLQSIASALVSSVAGDEWQLKPRPQKRGRPRRTIEEESQAYDVFADYERVLTFLQKPEVKKKSKLAKGEPEEQWRRRLKGVVRDAWAKTIGVETRSEPPGPGESLFDGKIVSVPLELQETLKGCIDEAAETASEGRPINDVIAYWLVGQRQGLSPGRVKHLVEVVRELDK